ncbi:hypothetical protein [Mycolicibacterium aubagnense]|uniref:hypothetical protein n=1 Tax=Mycolicibacterium aubagnense TaxID=319707 RepID=UPI0010FF04F0|nr:hypothetical protein [Mycolicibacterium aubagnense]
MKTDTAVWNTATGVVWVEFADGRTPLQLAEGVHAELDAYDAVVGAGFSRRANWLIVPGVPQRRSLDVAPTGQGHPLLAIATGHSQWGVDGVLNP